MNPSKFVAYYRISTARQGRSGLGLDAQRKAVADFLGSQRRELVGEFTEIENGKRDDRPELARALRLAKVMGAQLIVAKLDRLSRNAAFLLTLRDSGVPFVAADMPEANTLTIGILVVVAQAEREAITARTRAALAAAKARGLVLGNPNGAAALRRAGRGNRAAVSVIRARARQRAADLADTLADIEAAGIVSNNAIADELNRLDIPTARGGRWHDVSVGRLRARLV
jgi:DNA invertase Pin-like site-specific DNA recombinase